MRVLAVRRSRSPNQSAAALVGAVMTNDKYGNGFF
jgi:hypothetical protein